MNNLNLVVMGKTGAGKSTLINSILKEDLAPTGTGQPITKENTLYSKKMLLPIGRKNETTGLYTMVGKKLNLYDTVGLEIDNKITEKTLVEIQKLIKIAQQNEKEKDITLVWFCVNSRSSRFEPYEIELIKNLSTKHEIPFIVVITQCYTNEKGELEKQIESDIPEITVARILAKEYKTRGGIIPAFGIQDLLRSSIIGYDKDKVKILKNKLYILNKERERKINELKDKGKKCVNKYGDKAIKIGALPIACIPIVHGMCIKMLIELNKIVGIDSTKGFATDIFANVIVGIIATPLMGVPILSPFIASGYIESVGETYLEALVNVIEKSSNKDLKDNVLMAKRIKEELNKYKK